MKQDDRDYDGIKDAEIYDEIRDTRERDDNYDTIKIINTTETKRNRLVTCSAENDVFFV